jgi:hypothetical protein
MIKKYLPHILPHITIILVLIMVTLIILYQFNQWIANDSFIWIIAGALCALSFVTSVIQIVNNNRRRKKD